MKKNKKESSKAKSTCNHRKFHVMIVIAISSMAIIFGGWSYYLTIYVESISMGLFAQIIRDTEPRMRQIFMSEPMIIDEVTREIRLPKVRASIPFNEETVNYLIKSQAYQDDVTNAKTKEIQITTDNILSSAYALENMTNTDAFKLFGGRSNSIPAPGKPQCSSISIYFGETGKDTFNGKPQKIKLDSGDTIVIDMPTKECRKFYDSKGLDLDVEETLKQAKNIKTY